MDRNLYCNDTWIAFLCENIFRLTLKKSMQDCPACNNKIKSPLLHVHVRESFLDLIRNYFEEIRGIVLKNLDSYYSIISEKVSDSDYEQEDKKIYLDVAKQFLLTATPDSVYYGRYVDKHNDSFINNLFAKK